MGVRLLLMVRFTSFCTVILLLASLIGCGAGNRASGERAETSEQSLRGVASWANGNYGFAFDFRPGAERVIRAFYSEPGMVRELGTGGYGLDLKVGGRNWASYFSSDPELRGVEEGKPRFWAEGDGFEMELGLPLAGAELEIVVRAVEEIEVELGSSVFDEYIINTQHKDVDFRVSFRVIGGERGEGEVLGRDSGVLVLGRGEVFVMRLIYDGFDIESNTRVSGYPGAWVRVEGPEEDVSAIEGMSYRLWAATLPGEGGGFAMGPFGATSDRFGGHVFWDADVWVFPALYLTFPERATEVMMFRGRTVSTAWEGYFHWLMQDLPVANGRQLEYWGSSDIEIGFKYPWEADAEGKEGAQSDTVFQHHISAGVALMMQQGAALGIGDGDIVEQVVAGTKTFYNNRVEGRELKDTVSPSEWHTVNNDLYTNALVNEVYGFDLVLPRDGTTFLSFDGDKLREYQQAAALLAVYPVQHPAVEAEGDAMYDRYRGKTAKQGPAMSHSVSAIVGARLGRTEEAYEDWQRSWRDYTDNPWLRFREKTGIEEGYFYTGAAGCLNAVVYGFMGVRLDRRDPGEKPWKRELEDGWWISVEPNLPAEWTKLAVDVVILGEFLTFEATKGGLSVKSR